AGLPVAGIVEAHAGAALRLGPGVERGRLGAGHVGLEAAEPEQPRTCAGPRAHRDAQRVRSLAVLDVLHRRLAHRSPAGGSAAGGSASPLNSPCGTSGGTWLLPSARSRNRAARTSNTSVIGMVSVTKM